MTHIGNNTNSLAEAVSTQRLYWIDWLKSIGIYFIVLGHFFSVFHLYIYTFNVPLFFIISGFLAKKECSPTIFWKKLWYNLIIPLLLISVINFSVYCLVDIYYSKFYYINVFKFIFNAIIGEQERKCGLGACWFLYSLILIKIIFQFIERKKIHLFLSILLLFLAYLYNNNLFGDLLPQNTSNSILNVCLAYPFFTIGQLLSNYKIHLSKKHNTKQLAVILLISAIICYLCGHYNGYVWMFKCEYGRNILLFILGGISGTAFFYVISLLLQKYTPSYIVTISKGTILILGFHYFLIMIIRSYVNQSATILDFLYAAFIVVLFVPLIILIRKHFPLLLGKYRFQT